MKNKEVCEAFLEGYEEKTKNLFCENRKGVMVIYSYGYHFPMAIKLLDGHIVFNERGYSQTTKKHKTNLACALGYKNYADLEQNHDKNDITIKDTNYLNKVLSEGFKTRLEVIEAEI